MKNKILIIERWNIMEEKAIYIHKLKDFKSIKKFIKFWFKERKKDTDCCSGKMILSKTDHKSFAELHIQHEEYIDRFSLEILKISYFQRGLTVNLLEKKNGKKKESKF